MIRVFVTGADESSTGRERLESLCQNLISLGYNPLAACWMGGLAEGSSARERALSWMTACDAIVVCKGGEIGPDEEKHARACGIPVFHSTEELQRWFPVRRHDRHTAKTLEMDYLPQLIVD